MFPANQPKADYKKMQGLYRHIISGLPGRPSRIQEVWECDPIAILPPQNMPAQHKELYFIRKAFKYIDSSNDNLFAQLFWQAIRLKTLLFRHIVQRPMVTGLQWFIRFYDRISPMKDLLKPVNLESAYFMCGGDQGLKSLEIRKAPDNQVSELRSTIKGLLKSWQKIPNAAATTELGLVLHLSKDSGSKANKGQLVVRGADTNANPAYPKNNANYRYSHYFKTKLEEVRTIKQLLAQAPLSLYFIRGTDICSDELAIPNWIMAPLIQMLDKVGKGTAFVLSYLYPQLEIPPFRKTIHMGEDFCHLMDGIRHIEEVIEHFPLSSGDRIGHGLALGLEPGHWSQKHPVVWMAKEERLWNLIWELSIYRQGHLIASAGRSEWISDQIAQIAHTIFGPAVTIEQMIHLYADLFKLNRLVKAGFPDGEIYHSQVTESERSQETLLQFYLTDAQCFKNGQETLEVRQNRSEIEALKLLQRYVRQKTIEKEITIEVNPSSNFLIADLQELKHHPLWYLKPPPNMLELEHTLPPVRIAIGSDDPITFATRLPQEYALVCNVMSYLNIDRQVANTWLNQVRESGLNARFTLPAMTLGKQKEFLWPHILRELSPTDL